MLSACALRACRPVGTAGTQTGIPILFTLLRAQNEIWEGSSAISLAGKPIKGF